MSIGTDDENDKVPELEDLSNEKKYRVAQQEMIIHFKNLFNDREIPCEIEYRHSVKQNVLRIGNHQIRILIEYECEKCKVQPFSVTRLGNLSRNSARCLHLEKRMKKFQKIVIPKICSAVSRQKLLDSTISPVDENKSKETVEKKSGIVQEALICTTPKESVDELFDEDYNSPNSKKYSIMFQRMLDKALQTRNLNAVLPVEEIPSVTQLQMQDEAASIVEADERELIVESDQQHQRGRRRRQQAKAKVIPKK